MGRIGAVQTSFFSSQLTTVTIVIDGIQAVAVFIPFAYRSHFSLPPPDHEKSGSNSNQIKTDSSNPILEFEPPALWAF
jgi:hypothetical protein